VPFIVGLGTVIDNENNKNIEISGGKVIDNGNKTFVFGVALPGMQESLGIDKKTIDIPNSIEISMEAKDFEMNEIYFFATPKLIDEDDLELFNKIDKIYDMATELKDGSSKLVEGSQQLSEGAGKLNAGTHELSKELNIQIAKYENARKKLANKKELEEKIVNIINNEMKRIMPELQTLAEEEAKNVVKENLKGENGLEEKTAKTALDYTKIAINTKLNELEKSNTEIKIPDELLNQIQKDVMIAVKNVENKQDVQALENTIKNLVIKDITNIVKGKTNEVIT
jgi:putative membrane protein